MNLSSEVWTAMEIAEMAEMGFLPIEGGWMQQPAILIDVLRTVKNERLQISSEALHG